MRKIPFVVLCLAIFSISIFSQTNRETRPRVVTTPTPPQIKGDSQTETTKRPPVLQGGSQTPAQTQQQSQAEEVIEDDDEVIKIETNLVTLPVSVLDRDGKFIAGLKQKDFRIFENGIEQKIDHFISTEMPFTVVLMIDVSPSTQFQIDEIHNAAIAFVNQLRRDDKVMVVAFDQRVKVLSPPTNNRYALHDAIRRAEMGGGTSLYDAVDEVIKRHLRQMEGRKAIVIFSDGVDTTSRRADYDTNLRDAEEVDALIYPIRYDTYSDMGSDPLPRRQSGQVTLEDMIGIITGGGGVQINRRRRGGSGTSREEYETGRRYLEDLARKSGGRHFEAMDTHNLDTAFASIAEELRRQYGLGYYPENVGQKGERRQIRVRVMRSNVVVRAKDSYIVGQTGKSVAGK